ncbi:hypothetical protein [Enterovirga rhinocerotis]|uniref:Uncharacterized protein n=1 Tax=Enterovirga rhinocerotis TaxID=1339210 RepID=A0A4R7CAB2_9HYPH|nr:hypothetical protein [Enterovirga rhinocerotis]TDR93916.1 hypothetical protein EV668_1185 [Enterovirga rhinocerotis]
MRDGRTLLSIGAVSAVLAALVPGVLAPNATPLGSIDRDAVASPVLMSALERPAELPAATPTAPDRQPPVTRAKPDASASVPPGCERLVSSLARSVASRTISRCIT